MREIRRFTAEEDDFIIAHNSDMTVVEVAAALSRRYAAVVDRRMNLAKQGRLNFADRSYSRPWTQDEEDFLKENWGLMKEATIQKKLGRSNYACLIRAKRLGITRKMNIYTAKDVAEIFQVDGKTPTEWIDRGLLKAKHSHIRVGKNMMWQVDARAIERFILDHPEVYDRRRISHLYWRRLAEQAATAHPDRAKTPPKKHDRDWTPDEDAYLQAQIGLATLSEIGKHLGRTAKACESRAGKMGLIMTAHFITASAAATILGISVNRIHGWLKAGVLDGRKSAVAVGAKHQYWHIQLEDLNRFRAEHQDLIEEARFTKALGRGRGCPKGIQRKPRNLVLVPQEQPAPSEPWDVGQDAWRAPEPVEAPASPKRRNGRDMWAPAFYEGGGRLRIGT
jgi:hypothetical protein